MEAAHCNLCGSSRYKFLHEIPDLWLERFQTKGCFVICENCGLVYQHTQPVLGDDLYPDTYAVYQDSKDLFYQWGLKKRSQWVIKYKPPGRLLDIGAGRGDFITYMRDQLGWEVVGLEPNKKVAERTRREHNVEIIAATMEQAGFPEKAFDAITLWDVLEHLADPMVTLKEIKRILKPKGLLILRLPNYDSLDAKLFGKFWAGFDSPRHFYVFSKATIQKMLQTSGFMIYKIGSNIGQYPNFVKSVQFYLTGKKVSPTLGNRILAILRFAPLRILTTPLFYLKDLGSNGSEIIIAATPVLEETRK